MDLKKLSIPKHSSYPCLRNSSYFPSIKRKSSWTLFPSLLEFCYRHIIFRNNFLYVSNPRHSKWNIYEIIFVVLLLSLAFSIRLYRLGELGLWWDEFLTGTYVKSILQNGIPISPSGMNTIGEEFHIIISQHSSAWLGERTNLCFDFQMCFKCRDIIYFLSFSRKLTKYCHFVLIFLTFSPIISNMLNSQDFYTFNNFLFLIGLWTVWQGYGEKANFPCTFHHYSLAPQP